MKKAISLFALFIVYACSHSGKKEENKHGDDPNKEWSYLKKSTTVIGVPFQPDVTQVTYDGALYTRNGELDFFYGKKETPFNARQKTFYKGWIPVVQYEWKENGLEYSYECFANVLDGEGTKNTVNFVKLTVKNGSETNVKANLKSALCFRTDDYRFSGGGFVPEIKFPENSNYKIERNHVYRNDSLVYSFNQEATIESLEGKKYDAVFNGKELKVTASTKVCLAKFEKDLSPSETYSVVLKMPLVPVASSDKIMLEKTDSADYDTYKNKTIDFWENLLSKKAQYYIPEKKVNDAQKASMVHLLLATRENAKGKKYQTDGIPYPLFFLTSGPQMITAYLDYGLNDYAKVIIDDAIVQQEKSGLYFDKSLAHAGIIPAAHGHILYASTLYYLYTRDKNYGQEILPSIIKAIDYTRKSISEDQYGLMPPTYPYDNEMIDGHYASTNYWTLLGLRYSIRLAKDLDRNDLVQDWIALEKKYNANILKAIDASAKSDGYVPTGLYGFLTGKKARRNFEEYQTNSDWENMLLSFPTELLSPTDKRVRGTLSHIRKGYAEGIMTYRHGMHLHQYITANMIEQYMVQGETQQALIDFYHLLLHSGSSHEGFENLVKPWTDRMVDANCPPPHAWAAAKTTSLTRNFLFYEYGGKNGVEWSERELFIFPVISPEWVKVGNTISIKNAPSEMGTISAELTFKDKSAELKLDNRYRSLPKQLRFKIPYFKKVISVNTNATRSWRDDKYVYFTSDMKSAEIFWEDDLTKDSGITEKLLVAYRSTNYFDGVDKNGVQIIKQYSPVLTASEKSNSYKSLSFDLVKKTFLYEFEQKKKNKELNKTKK